MAVVKGVSRRVIVVDSPDPNIFEQAIFILKEGSPEVTDEMLLQQASRLMLPSSLSTTSRLLLRRLWLTP